MAGSSVLRAQKSCRNDSFMKMFSSDQDHQEARRAEGKQEDDACAPLGIASVARACTDADATTVGVAVEHPPDIGSGS